MNFNDKTNKFIEKNVNVKAKISELSSILFRLSFTDSDIASVIDKICSQGKVKVFYEIVDVLNDLYFKDKIFEPNHKNAVKRIILDTIDLYEEDAEYISKEIKSVLILAKKKGISPYKIAIKTNIRISTVEKFEQTLEALTKEKYNLTSTEKTELFSEEESKIILEQCASIACRVNAENLKNIIDLLRTLSFDKETKSYVFSVKDLLTQVPSLMGVSSKRIETAINLFELICDVQGKDSKKEIMLNIKKNPSILLINGDKINAIGNVCEDILFSLAKKVDKNLDGSNFRRSFNYLKLKKFIYNFDNLNSLNSTDEKTLISKAKILEKFLGTKNAINCFLNNHILLSDVFSLKFVLSYLAKVDKKNKNNDLKKAFVENPSKFLTSFLYDYDIDENEKQKSNLLNKQNKTRAKKSLNLCYNDFPNLDENYLEKIVKEYQVLDKKQYTSFAKSVSTIQEKSKEEKAKLSLERKIAKKEKKSKLKNSIIVEENLQEEIENTDKETAQNTEKEESVSKVEDASIINIDNNDEKGFQLPLTNYGNDNLPVYRSPFKNNKQCSFNEGILEIIKIINSLFDNLYRKQKKFLQKEDYLDFCYIGKGSLKSIMSKMETLENLQDKLAKNILNVLTIFLNFMKDNENIKYIIFGNSNITEKDWTIMRRTLNLCLEETLEIEESNKKLINNLTDLDENLWIDLTTDLKESEISRFVLFKEFLFFELTKIIQNLYMYFSEDIIEKVFGFKKDSLMNFLKNGETDCQFLEDLKTLTTKMKFPSKTSMKSLFLSKLNVLKNYFSIISNRESCTEHSRELFLVLNSSQNLIKEGFFPLPSKKVLENLDACKIILGKIRKFLYDNKSMLPTKFYDQEDNMYLFIDNSGDVYSKYGMAFISKTDDRYEPPKKNSKRIEIPTENVDFLKSDDNHNDDNGDGDDEKRD